MEPTGWIKLHRKILSNPLFKNPNYLVVWVHLLLRASYSERKTYFEGNLIDLKPGQIVIGYTQLASLTGLSRATCQRAISAIRDRYAIDTQAGRGSTLISIKNWESYQETDTQASAERALYKERRIKNKELNTNTINTSEVLKFSESSEAYQLSDFLFQKILELDPKAKRPKLQSWAKEMDKLMRIDKRSAQEIREMIESVHADPFWKKNILSASKLREKFTQLTASLSKKNNLAKPKIGSPEYYITPKKNDDSSRSLQRYTT